MNSETAIVTTITPSANDGPVSPRARAKYRPEAPLSPTSFESQPMRFAISALSSRGARRSASRYAVRAPRRSPARTRAAATFRQAA